MFVDLRFKVFVAQSISLIFALAILTHKFNKYVKFRCKILRNKFLKNQRYGNPVQPPGYSLALITSRTFREIYISLNFVDIQ